MSYLQGEDREQLVDLVSNYRPVCRQHPNQPANFFYFGQLCTRGFVCPICISVKKLNVSGGMFVIGAVNSDIVPVKSLIKSVHRQCLVVSQSVPTCAEADIILKQLKALYKQHISKWSKDFTNKLSEEMNKFFERVSTVLTGKYYDEFYHILIQIHMLREKESDKRISVDNQLIAYLVKYLDEVESDEDRLQTSFSMNMEYGSKTLKRIKTVLTTVLNDFKVALASNLTSQIELMSIFNRPDERQRQYTFSQFYKAGEVILIEPTIASINSEESQNIVLALIEPGLHRRRKSKIRLKIALFVGWISVGVCARKTVESLGYKLQVSSLDHGCYHLSNDGYIYAHQSSILNESYNGWGFTSGDIITLSHDPQTNSVSFYKNQQLSECKTIQMSNNSPELYFSVTVNYKGDRVQIL